MASGFRFVCWALVLSSLATMCWSHNHTEVPSERDSDEIRAGTIDQVVVFTAGEGGFSCYRIPILLTLPDGDMLAFVEARYESCSDYHARSILVKRSSDNGASWSEPTVVSKVTQSSTIEKGDGLNLGTAVYQPGNDTLRAKVWLAWVECFHKCTVPIQYVQASTDNGRTWDPPRDITDSIYALSKFAPGPGYGLYVNMFENSRMTMCGHYLRTAEGEAALNATVETTEWHDAANGAPSVNADVSTEGSACIYSDDNGGTWKAGIPVPYNSSYSIPDECQPVQVNQYSGLLMTMRDSHDSHHPLWTTSYDGGVSWDIAYVQPNVTTATCDASMAAINITDKIRLFFSHPDSTERENMAVHMSSDRTGAEWLLLAELWHGPAAYSCIQALPQHRAVGVLYENGEKGAYERITFAMVHFEVSHLDSNPDNPT